MIRGFRLQVPADGFAQRVFTPFGHVKLAGFWLEREDLRGTFSLSGAGATLFDSVPLRHAGHGGGLLLPGLWPVSVGQQLLLSMRVENAPVDVRFSFLGEGLGNL